MYKLYETAQNFLEQEELFLQNCMKNMVTLHGNSTSVSSRLSRAMCSTLSLSFELTPKTDRVPAVEFKSRSRGFISAAHLHITRATATAGALGDHLSYLRDRRWAWPITRSPGTEISPI